MTSKEDRARRDVIRQKKKTDKVGQRMASHGGRKKAPRLSASYDRNKGKLTHLRRKLTKIRRATSRDDAIAYAPSMLGAVEKPAYSNRGPRITQWQKSFGDWLVGQPWCGVLAGYILRHVGVKVDSRVASVALIEDDARAGRNGFRAWKSPREGSAGDLAVLFGRGVHVAFIEKKLSNGYQTIEGNTSPGSGGSQSNGGGSYRRFRPFSDVHGIAVPRYP